MVDRRRIAISLIFIAVIMGIALFHGGRSLNDQEKPAFSGVTEASSSDRQDDALPVTANNGVTDDQAADDQSASNYKAIFQHDLFIGDSVTQGLAFFELLDDSSVVAKLGLNLVTARKELDKVALADPDNIFILFGENDLKYYTANQQLIDSYADFIRAVRARAPHATIYVQSILPIAARAEAGDPNFNNNRINEVNAALEGMAAGEGARYLDLASVLKNRDDLYQPDGIHFEAAFYSLWLDFLVKNVK